MPLHLQALACTSAAASAATGPDGNNAAMTLAHMRDKHLDVTTGRGDFKFPELYINTGVTAHVTPPPFWCSEGVPPKVGLLNNPTLDPDCCRGNQLARELASKSQMVAGSFNDPPLGGPVLQGAITMPTATTKAKGSISSSDTRGSTDILR